MGGSGLLVLVSGFLPWWVVRLQGDGLEPFAGSAWRMSSRWTGAVLLAVTAAVVWVAWQIARGRVPVLVWLACLVAVGMSVWWTVGQLRDVDTWPRPEIAAEFTSGNVLRSESRATLSATITEAELADVYLTRDHLVRYTIPGIEAGTGWGFWVGATGMGLTGLSLVVAGRGRARAFE